MEAVVGPFRLSSGEEKDEALLGAFTLESLGLILNPFTRELLPMKLLLALNKEVNE